MQEIFRYVKNHKYVPRVLKGRKYYLTFHNEITQNTLSLISICFFRVLLVIPREFRWYDFALYYIWHFPSCLLKPSQCFIQMLFGQFWVRHPFVKWLMWFLRSRSSPFLVQIITWSFFLCQAFKLIISCFSGSVPNPLPRSLYLPLHNYRLSHQPAALP